MNLRWQPKYQRADVSPFVPFVAAEDVVEAEEVPAAREA
jgi:hypothetical protein